MAEQHERMTSTKCRDDVDPVQCMYDRQAYLEFFERSAAQSLDPSYDESLNGMFETLYGQHAEFVSKGCPTDPSAEGCSFAIMFSDIGMTALGVMFSVK